MTWTDKRVATLEDMWKSGSDAEQIARKLGGVTRNAVIGKAHRLGLKKMRSPSQGTVILSEEDTAAIRRVRVAEQELNEAIQALPGTIGVAIHTLDCNTMDVPADRENICINLSRVL